VDKTVRKDNRDDSPPAVTPLVREPAPIHVEPIPRSPAPLPAAPRGKQKHHGWIWFLILCAIIGAAAYWWFTRPAEQAAAGPRGGRGGAGGPIPVVTAKSRTGDMPIYLTEQGTVLALNTVTVRSRVDGQIDKIAFTEGQIVHQGDLLVEIDPRPFQVQLQQAQGQLAKDQASLNNAKLDLERFQSAGNAVSQQQLATQAATVRVDEATLKVDEAQIQSAQLNITYCRITAPITGRIGLRMVDIGNIVHASDPNGMAVITQLQPISVVFTIAQFHIPQVMRRLSAGTPPPVDAYSVYDTGAGAKLATGTLTAIDSQVDPASGTLKLKATFPNENNALFPNQFVNARLLVDTVHDAVIVPNEAVQRGPDTTFVYVVEPDQTVKVRNVEVGTTEGDNSVITSGLSAGETVVTQGVDKLQDGSKVTLRRGGATSGPSTRGATTARSSTRRRP